MIVTMIIDFSYIYFKKINAQSKFFNKFIYKKYNKTNSAKTLMQY